MGRWGDGYGEGAGYDALYFTSYEFVRVDGLRMLRARGIVLIVLICS